VELLLPQQPARARQRQQRLFHLVLVATTAHQPLPQPPHQIVTDTAIEGGTGVAGQSSMTVEQLVSAQIGVDLTVKTPVI
jgi:hypothetical protein